MLSFQSERQKTEADLAQVQKTPAACSPLPPDVSVLIVDDLPDELRLLAQFLSQSGARVMMATEGTQALRLAQQMRPDLVLLDVMLAPHDGFEVCRRLRAKAETASIPVIFLTGLTDTQAKLRGFAAGGQDFITKPFSAAEVLARLAIHVDIGRRLSSQRHLIRAPGWLTQAVQLIQRNPANTLSQERLAEKLEVTPRQLNAGFSSYLGITCAAFVRETRLLEAARLLGDPKREVTDIGQTVGYFNPANFSTAFKDRFGVSPRQYRQSRLSEPVPS